MIDIETHPLVPFLPSKAKLLMLGSFPPPQSRWKMDFYYPNYQNDMWRIFGLIFFEDKDYFLDLPNKNFKEQIIRDFLTQIGVGIFDTAYQVKRLQGNASDKFLEIVTLTDLSKLLEQIPLCHTIMTTGDKATDTLMQHFPEQVTKPMIGQSVQVNYMDRELSLYRLPSSSRAYPLALEKKANAYRQFFTEIGLV
ncbi:uracil-DNA glycosylase family protein [Acinetobacter haemolyticus]|uniref:Uracil-DNA glycosylase family protein n=1 Tax=Acinetobacter haemolyticus TaxID=29430 RepID=A0A1L6KMR5_ACIHA|nr:uracil-DNA glycosylase family protein [Acinetobacter haemolyticus]APR70362.1 DNA glycosylase [Acinetobacter haemolyticus]AZN69060.1 uracil-DNA glycosylase family protein [Acinetobacter haemolyticus]NAR18757.1 uracil-DNA glycosylase family protein [Acinetobacter haemolyticus]NAR30489.1 uracil-DNA glycosylase family protein [Acinetobacter haemolyticus]NAR34786.1 uracil-DNA glycosylase family protein [Acinetobacter haemolyticus]